MSPKEKKKPVEMDNETRKRDVSLASGLYVQRGIAHQLSACQAVVLCLGSSPSCSLSVNVTDKLCPKYDTDSDLCIINLRNTSTIAEMVRNNSKTTGPGRRRRNAMRWHGMAWYGMRDKDGIMVIIVDAGPH